MRSSLNLPFRHSLGLIISLFGMLSCGGGDNSTPSAPAATPEATVFAVIATTPDEDAPPIAPDSDVTVTFNRSVRPETVLEHFFVLDEMTRESVAGSVTYDEATKTARFKPELPFTMSGHYLGRIHTAVTDVNGNRLPVRFEWSFLIEDPPITQDIHFAPFDGQTDVHPRASVRIDFPRKMDAATITTESFQLLANGAPVPAAVTYKDEGFSISALLTPSSEMTLATEYNVRLAGSVTTVTGQPFANELAWRFTTAAAARASLQFGDNGENEAQAVTVDNAGNLIITGTDLSFAIPPPPGTGPVPTPGTPITRAWIRKVDSNGATLWEAAPFPAAEAFFWDVAADSKGDLIVTGSATSAIAAEPLLGLSDIIVVKVRGADGTTVWSRQLGTSDEDLARSVTVDATDAVYLTGSTAGTLAQNTNAGAIDVVIAKLNGETGATTWLKQIGSAGIDVGSAVEADTAGNVFVTGHSSDAFDGQTNNGLDDIFLARIAAETGETTSIRLIGTANIEEGHGLAVSTNGIFVAGFTVNPDTGQSDTMVAAFDAAGDKTIWTKTFDLNGMSMAHSLTADAGDLLYVTGTVDTAFQPGAELNLMGGFVAQVTAATGDLNWQTVIEGQNERGADHEFFAHVTANDIVVDANNNLRVCGSVHGNGGIDGYVSQGASDAFLVTIKPDGQRQ